MAATRTKRGPKGKLVEADLHALQSNPKQFDGKTVVVNGTIESINYRMVNSSSNHYSVEDKCVMVRLYESMYLGPDRRNLQISKISININLPKPYPEFSIKPFEVGDRLEVKGIVRASHMHQKTDSKIDALIETPIYKVLDRNVSGRHRLQRF
jgi:hypothetical protein